MRTKTERMTGPRYRSIPDLATRLEQLARAGRVAPLTPETALLVATALRAFSTEPSRDEVALALCTVPGRCPAPCVGCQGKANLVVRLYRGGRGPFDPPQPPDPGAGAPRRTASLKVVGE
jgi:hypothetical protein